MPSASTVAMDSSLLFQVTALSVASSGNTVALMVCVLPTVRTPSLESSVMDSIALPTVTLALVLTIPDVAVIFVVPSLTATSLFPSSLAMDSSATDRVTSSSVVSAGSSVYATVSLV